MDGGVWFLYREYESIKEVYMTSFSISSGGFSNSEMSRTFIS
ncbi:hypothetical protein VCRA219O19_10080 [Vibrio crassostreae]|nr:hypothetical protein VCRA219O19_10080 [Vibrio crassostreae]